MSNLQHPWVQAESKKAMFCAPLHETDMRCCQKLDIEILSKSLGIVTPSWLKSGVWSTSLLHQRLQPHDLWHSQSPSQSHAVLLTDMSCAGGGATIPSPFSSDSAI